MNYLKYQSCINLCFACAEECESCSQNCAKEDIKDESFRKLIQLTKDCSTICFTIAGILKKGDEHLAAICKVSADFCLRTAVELEKYKHIPYCKSCAKTCRQCARECKKIAKGGTNIQKFFQAMRDLEEEKIFLRYKYDDLFFSE